MLTELAKKLYEVYSPKHKFNNDVIQPLQVAIKSLNDSFEDQEEDRIYMLAGALKPVINNDNKFDKIMEFSKNFYQQVYKDWCQTDLAILNHRRESMENAFMAYHNTNVVNWKN